MCSVNVRRQGGTYGANFKEAGVISGSDAAISFVSIQPMTVDPFIIHPTTQFAVTTYVHYKRFVMV